MEGAETRRVSRADVRIPCLVIFVIEALVVSCHHSVVRPFAAGLSGIDSAIRCKCQV